MTGDFLIGGGFFTHEQVSLGTMIEKDKDFIVRKLSKQDILKPKLKFNSDYVVLFGIKGMARILHKSRLNKSQVSRALKKFLHCIPCNMPLVVADDWSLDLLKKHGNDLRKYIMRKFNVKLYLLREYLSTEKYTRNVVPFSLPCDDFSKMFIPCSKKQIDIFFQGNDSSDDRSTLIKKIRRETGHLRCKYKVTTGGVKNVKDRLSRKEFLKVLARSNVCLNFSGSGYDCYRYNEIASVGSIIATPKYPIVLRNDYEDMVSKITYKNVDEFKKKIDLVFGSSLLEDMQHKSLQHFRQFHTTEVRYNELKEYIEEYV